MYPATGRRRDVPISTPWRSTRWHRNRGIHQSILAVFNRPRSGAHLGIAPQLPRQHPAESRRTQRPKHYPYPRLDFLGDGLRLCQPRPAGNAPGRLFPHPRGPLRSLGDRIRLQTRTSGIAGRTRLSRNDRRTLFRSATGLRNR